MFVTRCSSASYLSRSLLTGLPEYFGAPPSIPCETAGHREWRAKLRNFVSTHMPLEKVAQWDEEQGFPRTLHNEAAAAVSVLACYLAYVLLETT